MIHNISKIYVGRMVDPLKECAAGFDSFAAPLFPILFYPVIQFHDGYLVRENDFDYKNSLDHQSLSVEHHQHLQNIF